MIKKLAVIYFGAFSTQLLFSLPGDFEVISGSAAVTCDESSKIMLVQCEGQTEILWSSFELDIGEKLVFQAVSEGTTVINGVGSPEVQKIEGMIASDCDISFVYRGDLKLSGNVIAPHRNVMFKAGVLDVCECGSIDVSSGFGGGNLSLTATEELRISPTSTLLADCLAQGKGGNIFLHSDRNLAYLGYSSASGLHPLAAAGSVSMCSQGGFAFQGEARLHSPLGCGTLFLDPKYILISPVGSDPVVGNTFAHLAADNVIIAADDLSTALNNANVVLQANTDIVFSENLQISSTTLGNGLSLQAGRSVIGNSSLVVTLNGGTFSATINDENALMPDRDPGVAEFRLSPNSVITTNGGDILVSVGLFGGEQEGVVALDSAELDAGGGDITLTGFAPVDGVMAALQTDSCVIRTSGTGTIALTGSAERLANQNLGCAVLIVSGVIEASDDAAITITGTGGSQNVGNVGVYCTGYSGIIQAENGSINVLGSAAGTLKGNAGIRLENAMGFSSTGTAPIHLQGSVAGGTDMNFGVLLRGVATAVTSVNGPVSIVGQAQGLGDQNQGVCLQGAFQLRSTGVGAGAATLTIQGTGEGNGSYNNGVDLSGSGIEVYTIDGNVVVDGMGNGLGENNQGVSVDDPMIFSVQGSATVTINSVDP